MTDKSHWAAVIDYNGNGNSTDAGDQLVMTYDSAYVRMRTLAGIHFGQNDTDFGAIPQGSNAWIYMEANFSGANVLQAYQTNQLKIEAFTE